MWAKFAVVGGFLGLCVAVPMCFVTGCGAERAKVDRQPPPVATPVDKDTPPKINRLTLEGEVNFTSWDYGYVVHDSKTGRDFFVIRNSNEIRVTEILPKGDDHGERGIQHSGREHP